MENTQYYEHTCLCGCGGQIEIKKWHKYKVIPKYLMNHWKPNLGKQHSEEHKQKLSEIGKNRKFTEERNKKISESLKGHVVLDSVRQKISDSEKGKIISEKQKQLLREKFSGKNNPMYGKGGELSPNWNNGSSFEPYGIEFNKKFKQSIYERDNYTCQCPDCEHKTDILDCHHIDYDKTNNVSENVITLCRSCHSKTNGKNNREFWMNYYQNIMEIKRNV